LRGPLFWDLAPVLSYVLIEQIKTEWLTENWVGQLGLRPSTRVRVNTEKTAKDAKDG